MMRLAIGLILQFLFSNFACAANAQVSVVEPRAFGHFLGDTIVRDVIITVPPGTQLRESALPQPGPRDYWLELVESTLTTTERRSSTEHRVRLTYQVFYAALEPKRLKIPGFKLYFEGPLVADAAPDKPAQDRQAPDNSTASKSAPDNSDPDKSAAGGDASEANAANTHSVASLEIIVSPLREIIPEKSASSDESLLRPDARATPQGTGRVRTGLLASLILGLGLITALAHHYAWFPFARRPNRPFARAARKLNAPDGPDLEQYGDELIVLHRAFDEAYGRRVLAGDIEKFFAERPEFEPLKDRIEQFYKASELAFFAGRPLDARNMVSTDAVGVLAHDMAQLERRAA